LVSYTPFNSKQFGGTVEAIFRAECAKAGYHPFDAPSGDYLPIDMLVYNTENYKTYRVQVKSTSTIQGGPNRGPSYRIHTKKTNGRSVQFDHVDVLAVYVQPFDAWYLIPGDPKLCSGNSLKFYTHVPNSKSKLAPFRDDWSIFNS